MGVADVTSAGVVMGVTIVTVNDISTSVILLSVPFCLSQPDKMMAKLISRIIAT
jgi:hypothetical protein